MARQSDRKLRARGYPIKISRSMVALLSDAATLQVMALYLNPLEGAASLSSHRIFCSTRACSLNPHS